MAKISELTSGQGNVDVEGTITDIGETRTFNKFGKELSVANATLKDDSGAIKLTLWNEDITRFKNNNKIKITNGYVNEFQGEKQLTSGKFGNIELIEEGSNDQTSLQEAPPEAPNEPQVTSPSEETPMPEEKPMTPPEKVIEEPKEEVF